MGDRADLEARFWSKANRGADDECWEWAGGTLVNGYGYFHIGGKMVRAHRFSYELLRGPIPEGLSLDHLCRNRRCVNATHLEPVDNRTNVLRGIGASAVNARRTHCVHGHPFNEVNTYLTPNGRRQCRECGLLRSATWRARQRAASCP